MNRTSEQIEAGVHRAIDDLSAAGYDLVRLPETVVPWLIREHLDYFLMMVGPSCPAGEPEIVAAVMRERLARTPSRRHPAQDRRRARHPRTGRSRGAGTSPRRSKDRRGRRIIRRAPRA